MWNIKRNRQSLEHGRELVGNSVEQLSPVSTNVSAVSIGAHSSTSWEVGQRTSGSALAGSLLDSTRPGSVTIPTERDYNSSANTLAWFVEYWHTRQRDKQTRPTGQFYFIFHTFDTKFNRIGLFRDWATWNLNFLGVLGALQCLMMLVRVLA